MHAIFAYDPKEYMIALGVYVELIRLIAGETKYTPTSVYKKK